jgi:hypothetical protein
MADIGNSDRGARGPSRRAPGPFDGYRLGAVDVPVRIRDLGVDGCVIESNYEVMTGHRITLQIELPGEGWITVRGQTRHVEGNLGFAVTFVHLIAANRERIERTVARLLDESPENDGTTGGPKDRE